MIRPILTEKSISMAAKGWYTFAVGLGGTKPQIAREIADAYKVTVTRVRTGVKHGKVRRFGRKQITKEYPDTKKALVRLKSGQTIAAFEMASETAKK